MTMLIGTFDAATGQYTEREASDEEIASSAVATLEAAIQTFEEGRAAKLAETDWWAIRASESGGVPMTDAQLAYRAELRAMDNAEGFDPFSPNWPVKPE